MFRFESRPRTVRFEVRRLRPGRFSVRRTGTDRIWFTHCSKPCFRVRPVPSRNLKVASERTSGGDPVRPCSAEKRTVQRSGNTSAKTRLGVTPPPPVPRRGISKLLVFRRTTSIKIVGAWGVRAVVPDLMNRLSVWCVQVTRSLDECNNNNNNYYYNYDYYKTNTVCKTVENTNTIVAGTHNRARRKT